MPVRRFVPIADETTKKPVRKFIAVEEPKEPGYWSKESLAQGLKTGVKALGGVVEGIGSTASGLGAGIVGFVPQAISTLSGLVPKAMGALTGQPVHTEPFQEGKKLAEKVATPLTYQPKTEVGAKVTEFLNMPVTHLSNTWDEVGRLLFPKSAEGQTAVSTIGQVATYAALGKVGAKIARGEPTPISEIKAAVMRGENIPVETKRAILSVKDDTVVQIKKKPATKKAIEPIVLETDNVSVLETKPVVETIPPKKNGLGGTIDYKKLSDMETAGEKGFVKLGDAESRAKFAEAFGLDAGERLYRDSVDKTFAVKKLVRDFVTKKDIELKPQDNPATLLQEYKGSVGKAEAKIFWGRFKYNDDGVPVKTGQSLQAIVRPIKANIDVFREYLIARHVPEVEARGIESGFDVAASKQFVARHPELETTAKAFTDYHNGLLNELVDSGLMGADVRDMLVSRYPNYAALNRIVSDIKEYGYVPTTKRAFLKIKTPIRALKGSAKPVIDPLESAVKATYSITDAVERARVKSSIIGLRNLSPELEAMIPRVKPDMKWVATIKDESGEPIKIFRPNLFQKEGIIDIKEGGDRHFYKVPKDIYDVMAGLDEEGNAALVRFLSIPARTLRAGATLDPGFAFARNPVRDTLAAFVNSKYGFYPQDFFRGLFHMLKKDDLYWQWKASGGEWAAMVTLDRATTQATVERMLGVKDPTLFVKHPIEGLETISRYGEMPTRIGVYERATKKGASPLDAALQSRMATADFAVRGAKTKIISQLWAFANARLQGAAQMGRSFKERPVSTSIKAFVGASLPSIGLYMINKDDPKYWEIPRWQRDMFWIIPMGGKYWRVPKGDIGMLFGTTAEKIMGWIQEKDPETVTQYGLNLMQQLSPIGNVDEILPNAFRGLMGVATNTDFFRGRKIVPEGKEGLEPKEQWNQVTSETAKAIGQKLPFVSPQKLEYLVGSYFGGTGRLALKGADLALGKMGIIPEKEPRPKEPADYPLVGALAVRSPWGFGGESVARFYDISGELDKFNKTSNAIIRRGDAEKFKDYLFSRKVMTIARGSGFSHEFNKAMDVMAKLRKAEEQIISSKLPVEQKRRAIDAMDNQVMQTVFPMLEQYKSIKELAKKAKEPTTSTEIK